MEGLEPHGDGKNRNLKGKHPLVVETMREAKKRLELLMRHSVPLIREILTTQQSLF